MGLRVDYFFLFAALPLFILFTNSVFPKEVPSVIIKIFLTISFGLALFPILTPVKFFTANTLSPFYLIILAGGILVLFIMIRALVHKSVGSWLSLVGFLFFITSVLYDMAANFKIIIGNNLGPFLPAGLFIFILFQSFILSRRFSINYTKLDNLTINLEKIIENRTLELQKSQEKNYEREKLAAMGVLVSGISHEIFNPLSGISGPLSIVKKEVNNSELKDNILVHKYIHYIENNIGEITSVIEKLNALINEREIKKEPILLIPVIRKVISNYSGISDKIVDISFDSGENDEVLGDSSIVYLIINNLVSNAVNAVNKKGSISIQLRVEGLHGMLVVEDTGGGMSREEVSKAFDVFYTTRKAFGGRGLGLFLVRKFSESLDWKVGISSQKDKGTKVTIVM